MINAKVDPNAISLPPGTVVGYRGDGRPIYNVAGGSVEFSTDVSDRGKSSDDDDDDDDNDDDDDSDDDEDSFVPPTKEQWEKLVAEKKKVDSESAQRKRLLRERGFNPKDGSPLKTTPKLSAVSDDDDDDDTNTTTTTSTTKKTVDDTEDVKALQKRLQREMERNLLDQEKDVRNEERTRGRTLMTAIPEALNTEGWNGKALPRILKLLDLDTLEVDEDGVTGLDDQVQELKNDFPEFFKRTRMKEAAEKVADRKTAGGGTKQTSPAKVDGTWAENIARALGGEG
jgi:hypothetical protein